MLAVSLMPVYIRLGNVCAYASNGRMVYLGASSATSSDPVSLYAMFTLSHIRVTRH